VFPPGPGSPSTSAKPRAFLRSTSDPTCHCSGFGRVALPLGGGIESWFSLEAAGAGLPGGRVGGTGMELSQGGLSANS
jgi:hypothetical protein